MKHETAALDKEGTTFDIYAYSEDVYAKISTNSDWSSM